MKMKKDDLYVFLHLPKCAGDTVRFHIENSFRKDEVIPLYLHDIYYNIKLNKKLRFTDFEKIVSYLKSLNKEQKAKIKVIHGHAVFYGIHKFFNKKVRYITTIRDPVSRTVSLYNFRKTQHNILSKSNKLNYSEKRKYINKASPV